MESDKKLLQISNRKKVWTVDVSFYPDEESNKLEEKFPRFRFAEDPENSSISIYGVNGQEEKRVFKMKFRDEDLMKIAYLSLKELLGSRKKVKKLDHILSKTIVPLFNPTLGKTHLILSKRSKKG